MIFYTCTEDNLQVTRKGGGGIITMTVEKIKNLVKDTDFSCYGIRIDTTRYNVGDIANKSHQLFQDQQYDEDWNPLYPDGEGIYSGFYDAGELGGTCAVEFNPEDDESVKKALEFVDGYPGRYITLIAGDSAVCGNDLDEIIIDDAVVLAAEEYTRRRKKWDRG